MSRFLTSTDTKTGSSPHIKKILSGNDVRIASAFLGTGAEKEVPTGARLICDIGMGGTSPMALEALSEKLQTNLRYLPNFHAKVYLSDNGCVVGSANLSNNGVGFLSQAKLLEAAIFVDENDKPTIKTIEKWFEELWNKAESVGSKEISVAKERWRLKGGTPETRFRYESLLEALEDPTGIAQEWHYLITREEIPEEISKQAEAQKADVAVLSDWPLTKGLDYFHGLDKLEDFENRADKHYISLHRDEKGKLHLLALRFLQNRRVDKETLSFFGKLDWKKTGVSTLGREKIEKNKSLSSIIATKRKDIFGQILTAKQFYEILSKS